MLVLMVRKDDVVQIDKDIFLVAWLDGGRIKIGIEAPKEREIRRKKRTDFLGENDD